MSCICKFHHNHECPIHGLKQDRPPKSKGKGNPLLRTKPLNRKSEKQEIRQAFIAGVKAERLWAMEQGEGVRCEECRQFVSGWSVKANDVMARPTPENKFIEAHMTELDAHHKVKRSAAAPYKNQTDHGVDSPTNLILVCRSCHRKLESSPRFGEIR